MEDECHVPSHVSATEKSVLILALDTRLLNQKKHFGTFSFETVAENFRWHNAKVPFERNLCNDEINDRGMCYKRDSGIISKDIDFSR